MSTWISSRAGAALLALALLPACAELDLVTRAAPETLGVAGRAVVIGGPPGYCIDRTASRDDGDSAFVLLGSCASIVQDASAVQPGIPGILTASVAEQTPGSPAIGDSQELLDAFFRSAQGRAALARDGRATSVRILETRRSDNAFYVRLRDASGAGMPGMSDTYWRGLVELNGHLITASVVPFADRPLSADAGFAKLQAFLGRIRAETERRTAGRATVRPVGPARAG